MKKIFITFLLIILQNTPFVHAGSSPKKDSPARFIQSLGNLEDCCQEIETLLAQSKEKKILEKKPRSNSFIDLHASCPLYIAIASCKASILNELRAFPAVNIRNGRTQATALHAACRLFDKKHDAITDTELRLKYLIIKALLILGYNPNMQDWQGDTSLHAAINIHQQERSIYIQIIDLLVKAGANPTICNHKKELPSLS